MAVLTAHVPTEAQAAYVASLLAGREVPPALVAHAEALLTSGTRQEVSRLIDGLKRLPFRAVAPEPVARPAHIITVGMYRLPDGRLVRIQEARTTANLYGRVLVERSAGVWAFEYQPGLYRAAQAQGVRLTLAEAQEFGHLTGTCCVCAAQLTDPKSVAAGIGPVCVKRV